MSEHKEHEHHLTSEALSVKLESSAKARNWIVRGVVIFLILVFFGGLALGANDLLSREEPQPPPPVLDESITNPPESAQDMVDILRACVSDAIERKPKLKLETKFDFGNEYVNTIEFTAPDADPQELKRLTNELRYLAPSLCEHLHTAILARDAGGEGSVLWDDPDMWAMPEKPENASPVRETQYGEDFSKLLWKPQTDPAQLENAQCKFIAYRCTACRKTEDEQKEQCPECKAKGTEEKPIMVLVYQENYIFTLNLADGAPGVDGLFRLSTPEQAIALLGDQLEGIAVVESIQLTCRKARIEADINRLTREIKGLRFKRDIDVVMELKLDPALSSIANVSLKFTLGENTNFSFVWPGVVLSTHERTMSPRENSQLTARFDTPDGQKTKHTWSSSDDDVCTVDEDGYLKAGKETGEAVITVAFELDGVTYSDECVVQVKTPAESVKVNRRSLKLDPGETRQLTAKVSPRKATYKEVTWHTEDPDIATVDENGKITAVAPGTVKVYALAQDGYFRSSCTVTVTGGGD